MSHAIGFHCGFDLVRDEGAMLEGLPGGVGVAEEELPSVARS